MITVFDEKDFQKEIQDQTVIVDFYGGWCQPCKALSAQLDLLVQQKPDVKVLKVDIDMHPVLTQEYGVMGVPTMFLFKDGQMIDKQTGNKNVGALIDWIETSK